MFRFAVAAGCANLAAGHRVSVEVAKHDQNEAVETYCPSVYGFTASQGKCIGTFIENFADGTYANYGQDSNGGIRNAADAASRCHQHYDCVGFYTREGVGYSHYRSSINYVDYSGFSSGYCCYQRSGYSLGEMSAETEESKEELEEEATAAEQEQFTTEDIAVSNVSAGEEVGYPCCPRFGTCCHCSCMSSCSSSGNGGCCCGEARSSCSRESHTDYPGGDIDVRPCYSESECCNRCSRDSRCDVAIWQPSENMCYLKDRGRGSRGYNSGTTALWR